MGAYLNISLLPVSNRLRGSEGDSLHKYTCIQICPDANDAPRSDPWAGIGSLSNPSQILQLTWNYVVLVGEPD